MSGQPSSSASRRNGLVAWTVAIAAVLALWFVHDALEQRLEETRQQLTRLRGVEDQRDECRKSLMLARSSSETGRAVLALLDHPGMRVVAFEPQRKGIGLASAVVDPAGKLFVVSSTLPNAPGKDYQIWLTRGSGPPQAAGLLHLASDGIALGQVDAALLEDGPPDSIAISIEPKGGSATATELLFVAKP